MRRHSARKHYRESAESWLARAGYPGERYTAGELARSLCVDTQTIARWIAKGWLRASVCLDGTYRIRRRAVRRLLADHPTACQVVMRAQQRYWRAWRAEHDIDVVESDTSGAQPAPAPKQQP